MVNYHGWHLNGINGPLTCLMYCSYKAKHLREKTVVFRVEKGYLLENFHGSMLVDLAVLPINKVIIHGKRFTIE